MRQMTLPNSPAKQTPQDNDKNYPTINIVGAGIAGLSLACHLRRRRIPFKIFDAASKPKGHTYGITISPWGYTDLLSTLEPKLTIQSFREHIAADSLVNGHGIATRNDTAGSNNDIRVSDKSLRNILAQGHNIHWNHKFTSAEHVAEGLKITFENGTASTANVTIDAAGERSNLSGHLLPDLKPEILPYAVYHGSRYIARKTFEAQFNDIFTHGENVRSFLPSPSQQWHLQLAKSYVTLDDVPSKAKRTLPPSTTPSELIIELRYTFSRRANDPSTDALFNPDRAANEATQIPPSFFNLVHDFISSSSSSLPHSISTLLSPSAMREDRILNWLMRLKTQAVETDNLRAMASHLVIAIGDAIHACPPVGSQGASLAMEDARAVAAWIESMPVATSEGIMGFYEGRVATWEDALGSAKSRLALMHGSSADDKHGQNVKLSGRI